MKTVYYITIAIISVTSWQVNHLYAQSSWDWQNPLPQGADMFAVFAISSNGAIITGSGGTMMNTINSGQNWHIQRLPEVDWVRQASFISETEGWIIGNWYDIEEENRERSKIFKTTDGGKSWNKLSISLEIDFSVYTLDDIEFVNFDTGYLLANPASSNPSEQDAHPGILYKSEDGGNHWTQISTGIERKYYQIVFTDSLTGYLLSQPYYSHHNHEQNQLHRTEDGGQTWITFPGQGYGKIQFINEQVAWAGNYRTIDGGDTWQYQSFTSPPLEQPIDRVWFTSSQTGYAISSHTILKTTDSGISWVVQKKTDDSLLQDIQFYDALTGFAAGYGGTVYMTHDAGENWIRYGTGLTEDLWDVYFTDTDYGWAVGANGTILHTKNGGNTWDKQSVPQYCNLVYLRAVKFLDIENGWATGGDCILVTDDGGENWKLQFIADAVTGPGGRIRDITFVNEQTGFAVGQEDSFPGKGFLYVTHDRGENWKRVDDGSLAPLDKIFFLDENTGWIAGDGMLLSTKNGGQTWHTEYVPGFLRYIQFTNPEFGWVSAQDEGYFSQTTDGGQTWIAIPYDENRFFQLINSFYFFDRNHGIAASFLFNNILSTEDGGQHWVFEERLPPSRLHAITFVNDHLGWAVGSRGAILKFEGSYFNGNNEPSDPGPGRVAGIYPNPFNSTTTVFFFLSQSQEATVSFYTITGKHLETLTIANARQGKNEVVWQPGNALASGIYLARIQSLEFTYTIKVLYTK